MRNKAIRVGILVFSAIILFIITIYLVGSKNNLFKRKTAVYCVFKDIKGVMEGNLVRYSGINVGSVGSINITSDSTVVLKLNIANDYAHHIYKNSIVEINQDGLMGSKLLSIKSHPNKSQRVEEGDTLLTQKGIDIENMLNMSNNVLFNVDDLVKTLTNITHTINSGKGDLGKLVNENALTTELNQTLTTLNSTLNEFNTIGTKINSGKGDIGLLVNKNKLTNEMSSLITQLNKTGEKANKVMQNLESTTDKINRGNGSISQLINSPDLATNIDSTLQNINQSLGFFNNTAKTIKKSWLLNIFSKKEKKKNAEKDTVIQGQR